MQQHMAANLSGQSPSMVQNFNQGFNTAPALAPTGPSVTFGATSKPRLPHPPTVNKNTVFFMVRL
jgi:hypothetical protein